jgi:hypothetical protein
MVDLLMTHGVAGLGIYWSIIEMLYEQGGKLMRTQCDRIAFALHTQSDLVKAVVETSELFVKDETHFWSESALRRIEHRESKSAKARESAHKKWDNANAMRPHSERNAIKERKGKEIKGNDINIESKDSQGPPGIDLRKQNQDRAEYNELKKEKATILHFIEKTKPAFINPYFDLWNIFAAERKLPKVIDITKARERQFATRIREKNFDFIKILTVAKGSEFILQGNWFTFDFILKSEANYTKVLEGNYQQKTEKKINGHQQHPPTREGQKLADAMAEIQATASGGPGN